MGGRGSSSGAGGAGGGGAAESAALAAMPDNPDDIPKTRDLIKTINRDDWILYVSGNIQYLEIHGGEAYSLWGDKPPNAKDINTYSHGKDMATAHNNYRKWAAQAEKKWPGNKRAARRWEKYQEFQWAMQTAKVKPIK